MSQKGCYHVSAHESTYDPLVGMYDQVCAEHTQHTCITCPCSQVHTCGPAHVIHMSLKTATSLTWDAGACAGCCTSGSVSWPRPGRPSLFPLKTLKSSEPLPFCGTSSPAGSCTPDCTGNSSRDPEIGGTGTSTSTSLPPPSTSLEADSSSSAASLEDNAHNDCHMREMGCGADQTPSQTPQTPKDKRPCKVSHATCTISA
jgi:hypothetical protein